MRVLSGLLIVAAMLACTREPTRSVEPYLDRESLVVGAGHWRFSLVKDCGIRSDLSNFSLDAMSLYDGARIVFLINQIPVAHLETRTGHFVCREAAAAFRPAA